MPRTGRLDVLGVVHHVMARGIEGCTIFRDDRDREEFLRRLEEVVVGGKAQLLAWALIPNHYHLVIRPLQMHLKDLMRRLMTGYAGWHNRRHGRRGQLADLARLTGRTQPAVWQAVQRYRATARGAKS